MADYIGLSLSFCVADIVLGKVALDDVHLIIANTKCATQEDWEFAIARYRQTRWAFAPDECEQVARQLIADDKVTQPRLRGEQHPDVASGYWRPAIPEG